MKRSSSLRFLLGEPARAMSGEGRSKIALLLLLLHADALPPSRSIARPCRSELVDDQHLGDDLLDRRRLALDRARQRVATERPEPHLAHHRLSRRSSGKRSSSTIRIRPSRSTVGRSAAK